MKRKTDNSSATSIHGAADRKKTRASLESPLLSEWEILMEMFHSTNGAEWKDSHNWGTREPLSKWKGVQVNQEGEVTGLKLAKNRLIGTYHTSSNLKFHIS